MQKAIYSFMHCICFSHVYIPYIFQFLHTPIIIFYFFLLFLQKNSGNSELSSLVPAAAELNRYGFPYWLYPLPVSNLVFSISGDPPQVCFLKFFIILFCTAGNPPNFLLNLVQRYNKFLIYANYLLKKCIIYSFCMRIENKHSDYWSIRINTV